MVSTLREVGLPKESKNCTSVLRVVPAASLDGRLAPMEILLVADAVPPTRLRFTVSRKSLEITFWLEIDMVLLDGITTPEGSVGQPCRKKPAVLRRNPSLSWKNEPARVNRYSSVMVATAASLTTKKPLPERAMSVGDVDAANNP